MTGAAQRLRANFAAVRVNFTWFGTRKALTTEQKAQGADPHIVRNSPSLREHITTQLSAVQSHLDQMLVDAPRRRILRAQPAANTNGHTAGS